MNKLATCAAIGVLGLGALAATSAEAQQRRLGGYSGGFGGYHGGSYGRGYRRGGGAVAAGAIFGLATGALLAGAATAPGYGYYDQPVYYAPPPGVVIYSAYPPAYGGYPGDGSFGGGYYGGGYPGGGYYGGGYPGGGYYGGGYPRGGSKD